MGGKSTLLRATCLAVIMAQVLILLHSTRYFNFDISDEQLIFLNCMMPINPSIGYNEKKASTHLS
jgi:hypothetical protein